PLDRVRPQLPRGPGRLPNVSSERTRGASSTSSPSRTASSAGTPSGSPLAPPPSSTTPSTMPPSLPLVEPAVRAEQPAAQHDEGIDTVEAAQLGPDEQLRREDHETLGLSFKPPALRFPTLSPR